MPRLATGAPQRSASLVTFTPPEDAKGPARMPCEAAAGGLRGNKKPPSRISVAGGRAYYAPQIRTVAAGPAVCQIHSQPAAPPAETQDVRQQSISQQVS